jgi:selenocysteine lyase/cysteine desulfurase
LTQKEGFALRHGHMYAYRLLTALRLPDINDGVVRVSLLHYNTPAEVQGLIKALTTVLPAHAS